jgi:hypothetical protein
MMGKPSKRRAPIGIDAHPLTLERWDDLVTRFTGRGRAQVRRCWSKFYRRSGRTDPPPGVTAADVRGGRCGGDARACDGVCALARRTPTRPVVRKALRASRAS